MKYRQWSERTTIFKAMEKYISPLTLPQVYNRFTTSFSFPLDCLLTMRDNQSSMVFSRSFHKIFLILTTKKAGLLPCFSCVAERERFELSEGY